MLAKIYSLKVSAIGGHPFGTYAQKGKGVRPKCTFVYEGEGGSQIKAYVRKEKIIK